MEITKLDISYYNSIIDLWKQSELLIREFGRDSFEAMSKQFSNDNFAMFGITNEAKLIAIIMVTDDSRKGWINRLAVSPKYRNQGIAKKLIRHGEEYLQSREIDVIACLIKDGNDKSISLHKSLGYVVLDDIHYLAKRTYEGA